VKRRDLLALIAGAGLWATTARPPANITGVGVDAGFELYGKQLQILQETVPGGLMAYAPDLAELARQRADRVHQLLGGAKPSDISIYQATTFKPIINLNAANCCWSRPTR
jgi:hypothetical protein